MILAGDDYAAAAADDDDDDVDDSYYAKDVDAGDVNGGYCAAALAVCAPVQFLC